MKPVTEVRIALVLNGGVSLAVWMGGVAHEIDLLRRASANVMRPPTDSPDRPVYDAWRRLCKRHNVQVVVDIVSGTSAGGLNGTLLATAIARGVPLDGLQQVWEDTAQLSVGKLIPAPGTTALPSILDGDYFAARVTEVLDAMPQGQHSGPVTLFVTATALGRHEVQVADSFGSVFPVPDHRRLYRFRYDPTRRGLQQPVEGEPLPAELLDLFPLQEQDDFGPDCTARLARAARASASFPVAFTPVREVDGEVDLTASAVRVRGTGQAWLVDGGILDNAPFDPVVEEIVARPVDRPWRRVLAYVVPSGALPPSDEPSGARPGWLPVVRAATRLPAEADLRGDVERLTELAQGTGRWVQQPQELFEKLRGGQGEELETAARAVLPAYRQARVDSGANSARWLWVQGSDQRPMTFGACEPADLDGAEQWVPPADWEQAANSPPWHWGTAVADRVVRMLLRDLARRPDPSPTGLASLSDDIACIGAVRLHVEERIRSSRPARPSIALAVAAVSDAIRQTDAPRLLDAVVRRAAGNYLTALGRPAGRADRDAVLRHALVVEVLARAFGGGLDRQRTAMFDVVHMGPDVDSPVVPDAQAADETGPRPLGAWKLWGTQLNHFGAFGKTDWRRQDWVWGRLDGAAHLARIIHASGELADEHDSEDDIATLQVAVLAASGTTAKAVQKNLQVLLEQDTGRVLTAFRATAGSRDQMQNAVQSALRTLRSGECGIPPALRRAGEWLNVVLVRDLPEELSNELDEDGVRLVTRPLRKRFWRAVRGTGPGE